MNHGAADAGRIGIEAIVAGLRVARDGAAHPGDETSVATERPRFRQLPSREILVEIVRDLRAALFPAHFGALDLTAADTDGFVRATLAQSFPALEIQLRRAFHFDCAFEVEDCAHCAGRAAWALRDFSGRLPEIAALLRTDVRAAYEGDPAASSVDEAIFCYPGVTAITHHRLAHALCLLGVPLIPRIVAEIAHGATGIDIHPSAAIGDSFFIDHGTGVVIGETALIGRRVRLYQGVTLGARSFALDERGLPRKGIDRHPIIEDDVTIYAGATILGRIRIGAGSIIGGNVWLTRSVPPASRLTQAQAQSDSFERGSGI